jgi:predicted peptidase
MSLIAGASCLAGCVARAPGRVAVPSAACESAEQEAAVRAIAAASPAGAFGAATFRSGEADLPYRLLEPPDSTRGGRHPLVLVLHGSGAIGTDNQAQLGAFARAWARPELRQRFPAYVVVPHFAERSAVYAPDARDGLLASRGTPALTTALSLVDHLAATRPVDARRVYVVGFSMGASAAWHALLLRPGRFAGAVAIAGVPPERAAAPALARTPLLVVHGAADPENPDEPAAAMYRAVTAAGSRRVRFWELQGPGHCVPAGIMADTSWREWLFSQRLP